MSRALRLSPGALARGIGAAGLALSLVGVVLPTAASAQFRFFGQGETSAQDAYDTIAAHGFRLAGPMMQNRDVFIADVFDRRQRRQRLIISRNTGEITQRFYVDLGGGSSRTGEPRRSVARNGDTDFMSRLVHGFGDGPPPRPPADVDGEPDDNGPRVLAPPRQFVRPRAPAPVEPKIAVQREDPPIIAKPLPAPAPSQPADQPAAVAKAAAPQPAPQASVSPPPAASAPSPRATVVSTDPLRIPGERVSDAPRPASAAAAAKPMGVPPVTAAAKPKQDVPVAPLD